MAWKHDVDRQMDHTLGQDNWMVSPATAERIIKAAVSNFGLASIHLECSERDTIRKYGHAAKQAGSYEILLYPKGMNVLSVLHEIAHCFPDGYNHYIGWTHAFFRLVEWFIRVKEEFRPVVSSSDDFDL